MASTSSSASRWSTSSISASPASAGPRSSPRPSPPLSGLVVVVRLSRGDPRPSVAAIADGRAFRRMIAVNRDIMIRSFALLFAFAFFTARSADAGDVVLAANEILVNLTIVAAYFLDGLAAAAEQFAGRAIGARHRPAFDRAMRLTIVWGYGVAAAASLFLLLAGPFLIDAMTTSASVRAAARGFLLFAALVPVAGTLAYQMDGIFIGATWSSDMRNMMLALARRLSRRLVGPVGSARRHRSLGGAPHLPRPARAHPLVAEPHPRRPGVFLRATAAGARPGLAVTMAWRRGLRPRQLFRSRSRRRRRSRQSRAPRGCGRGRRGWRAAVRDPLKTRPV